MSAWDDLTQRSRVSLSLTASAPSAGPEDGCSVTPPGSVCALPALLQAQPVPQGQVPEDTAAGTSPLQLGSEVEF